jgi:hypothetical protein
VKISTTPSDYYTWSEYNVELLKRRFPTSQPAEDYSWYAGIGVLSMRPSLAEQVAELRDDVQTKLRRLQSLKEQLPIIDESHHVVAKTTGHSHEERADFGDLHRSRP